METFPNMYVLLEQSRDARRYYDALPEEVRRGVQAGAEQVKTYQSLRTYAERLARGDD